MHTPGTAERLAITLIDHGKCLLSCHDAEQATTWLRMAIDLDGVPAPTKQRTLFDGAITHRIDGFLARAIEDYTTIFQHP